MKQFLLYLVLFNSFTSFAQQKLMTMQEAIGGIRPPENLRQLQFVEGSDDYIYLKKINGADVYVRSNFSSKEEVPVLTLSQFNQRLRNVKQDSLKSLPPLQFSSSKYTATIKGTKYAFSTIDQSYETLLSRELGAKNNLDQNDSGFAAYLQDNNLFVTRNGDTKQVTTDGTENIIYASTVHREEFGITKGTFWNNKGDQLAFYRMDQSMVTDYPIIDWTERPAKNVNIKYPMAGDKSHEVTVGVYNTKTATTVWLKTTDGNFTEAASQLPVLSNPKERYLTNIAWSPDDRYIFIAVLNRAQNHTWLNKYDAATGNFVSTLFEEEDEKYVEPLHPIVFVKNKPAQFIWQSNRDGWNHLYLYDTNGKMIKQLTAGQWEVTDMTGFDEKGENIFYVSTEESPLTRNLYAVNLKSAKSKRLTPLNGVHTTALSSSGKYLIDNFSNTGNFRTVNVIELASGKTKNLLEAASPLVAYATGARSLFSFRNRTGTDIYCRLFKPTNFDSTKKYPVIVYWYGGPHAQLIRNNWDGGAGDNWFHYLAQRGYVVFSIDPRGSEGRGKAFEQAIYRRAGVPQMEDMEDALKYLGGLGYADEKRMGLFGWSYGGFMTTDFMLNHPGVFKAAVAGGPVMNWQYYEIMYGERYMDTPQENPEGYAATNLISKAGKLKGKLLLIHGLQDPVVVQENSVNFVKAAVDAGVQVDYMIYPGYEHNVIGKDRAHLYQKVTDYFEANLKNQDQTTSIKSQN